MREIVLDTETTGLNPFEGDKIVEIGCIELINHITTGEKFHQYINPERGMPETAFAVHGLSEEFLYKQPVFGEIVDSFIEFIGNSNLIIHNAQFDMSFINSELANLNLPTIHQDRVIDTIKIARKKFPGAQASLDALCKRFNIDNSNRELHGALLDAELLAEVYLELIGGRQSNFALSDVNLTNASIVDKVADGSIIREARPHEPSIAEKVAHEFFLDNMQNPIWRNK